MEEVGRFIGYDLFNYQSNNGLIEYESTFIDQDNESNIPLAIAIRKYNDYAYIAYSPNYILTYSVEESGTLTYESYTFSESVSTSYNGPAGAPQLILNYLGTNAYFINYQQNSISMYSIDNNGNLIPLYNQNGESTVKTGQNPTGFALSPDEKFAYAPSYTDSIISMYIVESSGALAPLYDPKTNMPSVPSMYPIALASHVF